MVCCQSRTRSDLETLRIRILCRQTREVDRFWLLETNEAGKVQEVQEVRGWGWVREKGHGFWIPLRGRRDVGGGGDSHHERLGLHHEGRRRIRLWS